MELRWMAKTADNVREQSILDKVAQLICVYKNLNGKDDCA